MIVEPLKLKVSQLVLDEMKEELSDLVYAELSKIDSKATNLISEIHVNDIEIWATVSFSIPIKPELKEET